MKKKRLYIVLLLAALSLPPHLHCGGGSENTPFAAAPLPAASGSAFGNPRQVAILDYQGDAMEPFLSMDGNTLFFNNRNSDTLPDGSENDTDIHYAHRIDDTTFQYMGTVDGADTDAIPGVNELEGVASMDLLNKFYWVDTSHYLDQAGPDYLLSLFRADYANGALTNRESLPNLKSDRPPGQDPIPGELVFDAYIHCLGEELYFSEGIFSGKPYPDAADICLALENNGTFAVAADSREQLALVNTDDLEYAPCISPDRLELFFTRLSGSEQSGFTFGIYRALRPSAASPWTRVEKIEAIDGDATEAPSLSFDGRLLYYHRLISGEFTIFVVERSQ